jgi:hypothetical protein
MAVKITLEHTADELSQILMYEQAIIGGRPDLSAQEIRDRVAKHYKEVSRSAIMNMSEKDIKNLEPWSKRVVQGKGFHFKPRNPKW